MNNTNQDIIVANPSNAQQLFVLLHDIDEQPQDCLSLAQHLQTTFSQATIIAAATPEKLLNKHTAAEALQQLLSRFWQATALDATRTAVICQGVPYAIYAASQKMLCARLFAVGDCLPHEAAQLSEHTTLHCLHPEGSNSPEAIENIRKKLRQVDVDFTLDVMTTPCTYKAQTVHAHITHLLKSHVPQRLWREAMQHIQE